MIARLLNCLIEEWTKARKKQILHIISIYFIKKAFCLMVNTFTLTCFREKAGNVTGESLVCGYYYVTANSSWRGLYFRLDSHCLLCLSR